MDRGKKRRLTASGACLLSIILVAGLAKAANPTSAPYQFDGVSCGHEQHHPTIADHKLSEDARPLIDWVVAQTGWTIRDTPPIRLVPYAELAKTEGADEADAQLEAIYSEREHVIYLTDRWLATNLRDRSILLHEIVHHLQFINHVKATCDNEYEFQAYKLQSLWLGEHGVEHPLDFLGINPLFILMLSRCE